jgi:thymidine phosphorylase
MQGAEREWLAAPTLEPAPHEVVYEASRDGFLSQVATRELGLLLAEASQPEGVGGVLDDQVALRYESRLGDPVKAGQLLARLYLRRSDPRFEERFQACFKIADEAVAPVLIRDRISAA